LFALRIVCPSKYNILAMRGNLFQEHGFNGFFFETATRGATGRYCIAKPDVAIRDVTDNVTEPNGGECARRAGIRRNFDIEFVAEAARRNTEIFQRGAATDRTFAAGRIYDWHAS
jgi:hypothetical protein